MAQPRARRGRRVMNSDDEASTLEPTKAASKESKQTKLASHMRQDAISLVSSQASTASPTPTPTPTPESTPKKPRAKAKAKTKLPQSVATGKPGTRTIYSFFNTATQKQAENIHPVERLKEEADDIHDQLSDSEVNGGVRKGSKLVLAKKRSSDAALLNGLGSFAEGGSQTRQKFLKKQDDSRTTSPSTTSRPPPTTDFRPWTEKYAPSTFDELVVHKKKVSDVRQWLEGSMSGQKHKRLLVLKGAAGCGKTATLTALSKVMNFQVIEWKNPSMSDVDSGNYASVSSQFEDFLGRGRAFGSLEIVNANGRGVATNTDQMDDNQATASSQVLLIEEFPNNITRSTETSRSFRSAVLQSLAVSTFPSRPSTPLVMIISESVESNSSTSVDNFTAHRLLGPEILHSPSTAVIEFNAVAQTFIERALRVILQKRSGDVGHYHAPHPDVLKKLSEFGDVRNATSALEFICSHVEDGRSVQAPLTSKARESKVAKSKPGAAGSATSTIRDGAMSLISLRESSVGLFHSVGKIVYNKRSVSEQSRDDSTAFGQDESLPDHMRHHVRTLRSEVHIDTLIDETGTDTSTFLSALHENYLLSCNSPDNNSETAMDSVQGCLDALCDADILSHSLSGRGTQYNGGIEGLRQSDLAFHVGTRGLLFSLPYPVKRMQFPGGGKGDGHKMFYPTALKLWRKREEIQGLADILTVKAISGVLLAGIDLRSSLSISEAQAMTISCSLGSGNSATHEMVMERLPYMVYLLQGKKTPPTLKLLKQIEQVTRFTGVRMLQGDDEEDGDEDSARPFNNLPDTAELAKRGLGFMGLRMKEGQQAEELDMQRLVLIDDDIEDD